MKKFEFSLESVLRYKRVLQDKAAEEFNASAEIHRQGVEELDNLRAKERSLRHDLKDGQQGEMDVTDLIYRLRYLTHISRVRKTKTEEVRQQEMTTEKLRQELVKVLQDKNVVEKLREKRHTAFLADVSRLEQNFSDENSVNRHSRRNIHGR